MEKLNKEIRDLQKMITDAGGPDTPVDHPYLAQWVKQLEISTASRNAMRVFRNEGS